MTGTDPLVAAAQSLEAQAAVTTIRRLLERWGVVLDDPDTPPDRRAEIHGYLTTLLERIRAGMEELEAKGITDG